MAWIKHKGQEKCKILSLIFKITSASFLLRILEYLKSINLHFIIWQTEVWPWLKKTEVAKSYFLFFLSYNTVVVDLTQCSIIKNLICWYYSSQFVDKETEAQRW